MMKNSCQIRKSSQSEQTFVVAISDQFSNKDEYFFFFVVKWIFFSETIFFSFWEEKSSRVLQVDFQ